MATWLYRVKIKHLMTTDEDHAGVQRDMNAIADVLVKEKCFNKFALTPFRDIPAGDEFFGPVDYANKLLSRMYDYADQHRIWID